MNNNDGKYIKRIDEVSTYRKSEDLAKKYFGQLYKQQISKNYEEKIIEDINKWKKNHVFFSIIQKYYDLIKPSEKNFAKYIKWMDRAGKIDSYLDRSISYLFIRDLGKSLTDIDTKDQITRMVLDLKEKLIGPEASKDSLGSFIDLYREAQREGIEDTMIWLMEKLKRVAENIPKELDYEHAQRKLLKIILGVLLHEMDSSRNITDRKVRVQKLSNALKLGYSYGLTYPFIDDLLDSNLLNDEEKMRYSEIMRVSFITSEVPDLGEWDGENKKLMEFVHSELKEAFLYIKSNKSGESLQIFLEQAYVFFNSQEVDRTKLLENPNYTNEEIFVPIIIKASSSRLIARTILNSEIDEEFDMRTFYYGIYNQLSDDFADMFDDLEANNLTPYTYYLKYHNIRNDLINPFELFWNVIFNLIHNVYNNDEKTCEVLLDRAINGLKRSKQRLGVKKFSEIMEFFCGKSPSLKSVLLKMVNKATDIEFFDKLMRDRMINNLKESKKDKENFKSEIDDVSKSIGNVLEISELNNKKNLKSNIIEASNYSLNSGGKKLRSLIAWSIGVKAFGYSFENFVPIFRALEYMHTASLIFDDLPTQDNSDMRRGNLTLHKKFDVATAELAALFLTQKSVEEQSKIKNFNEKNIINMIEYTSTVISKMCLGQSMDLLSKNKVLTLEELKTMCFYKTGLAFEASIMMPLILVDASLKDMELLKKYSEYAGLAFQIKDDILDFEGNEDVIGKPSKKDFHNNSSTFVTVLGINKAKREMWACYCEALDSLNNVSFNVSFLRQILDYIIYRDK